MDRQHLRELLDDYSLEEIIEASDVEVIDALELLINYNIINVEWSDGSTEND